MLDWAGFVASGQVPGLAGDGIHLGTAAAKQFYANYVFDIAGRRDLVQPLPELRRRRPRLTAGRSAAGVRPLPQ